MQTVGYPLPYQPNKFNFHTNPMSAQRGYQQNNFHAQPNQPPQRNFSYNQNTNRPKFTYQTSWNNQRTNQPPVTPRTYQRRYQNRYNTRTNEPGPVQFG